MFIVNILGFASLGCLLSLRYKEKINTVVQTALGIWMLLLYVLAFFQKLSWIDGISVVFILLLALYIWKKKLPVLDTAKKLADAPAILFVMTVVILAFLVKDKMVTDGDELGVWGPEPKTLYMLDGFAGRYENLLSGYSAYHPGAMLVEWWTCHFSPGQFYEGLLYVGVWLIILCAAAPVFENITIKRRWAVLLAFPLSAVLILLPSMFGRMNYYLIAEMPMSMVFAGCLLACFDNNRHTSEFRFLRLTVGLAFLMLLKETGVIFAVFVLLFYWLQAGLRKEGKINAAAIRFGAGSFAVALVPMLLWRVYCAVYERSNYFAAAFDSTVDNLKTSTFTIAEDLPGYAKSMVRAWLTQPLHATKTLGLDLTPLAAVLLVLILCWFCVRNKILAKAVAIQFVGLYAAFMVVYMAMLLFMHAYIFGERGYLEPGVMVFSVARYAEPLFLGLFVYFAALILHEALPPRQLWKKGLAVAAVIVVCADAELAKNNILDYTEMNRQASEARATVLQQEPVAAFAGEVAAHLTEKDPARILWISDREDTLAENGLSRVFWNLFAPKTYAYYQVDAAGSPPEALEEILENQVAQLHFGYVYFDFENPAEEQLPDMQIENRTLYRVAPQEQGGIGLELAEVQG